MARGKYGPSAAARRLIDERDREVAACQRSIRKLTAENTELKQRLDSQREAHHRTVQDLKTQRDEGQSPMLTTLQKEMAFHKSRADEAERTLAAFAKVHSDMFDRIVSFVRAERKMTLLEALEIACQLIGEDGFVPPELRQAQGLGPEAVRALERKRGWRV